MKRRTSQRTQEEDSRFSKLLFEKSDKLVKKLQLQDDADVKPDIDQKPAWVDDDDANYAANIIPNVKSEALYVDKLKQKYETLMGTPSWAQIKKAKQEDTIDDAVLRKVGHVKKSKRQGLSSSALDIVRVGRVNYVTGNEGPYINCIEFHPKSTVALVAGQAGTVSLFSVGTENNDRIHSFKLKHWNIQFAHFTPDGNEAFISSHKTKSYCAYDLIKAVPSLVPLPKDIKKANIFKLSPDGKLIAIADVYDEIFIVTADSRELIKILKHNNQVASMAFSPDSKHLYSFGSDGLVTIWDTRKYESLHKFYDSGCVRGSRITVSRCGKLLATGSKEGIVNIYETANLKKTEPVPVKVVSNLTTKITTMTFNPTTELLAIASDVCPDATKMIHIPSYTAFKNYPKQKDTLYQVSALSFSPNSGYFAIGNNKSQAPLYRLKYYKNY